MLDSLTCNSFDFTQVKAHARTSACLCLVRLHENNICLFVCEKMKNKLGRKLSVFNIIDF